MGGIADSFCYDDLFHCIKIRLVKCVSRVIILYRSYLRQKNQRIFKRDNGTEDDKQNWIPYIKVLPLILIVLGFYISL